jgi:nucleoside-diphosphate-sugar epimerase
MAREALREGHEVWTITRGQRPLVPGVRAIIADRGDRAAFEAAIAAQSTFWDLVIDCICFHAEDARQDLHCFTRDRTGHLVMISTDSVIEPADRPWKIDETYDRFASSAYGRGKREAEEILVASRRDHSPRVTVLRPGHIYGPGSLLGIVPRQWRDPKIIDRIQNGRPLALVGGGRFIQQPIFSTDLWRMARSCLHNDRTDRQIYFAPGADTAECRDYYRFIADALNVSTPLIEEISVTEHLREHPESAGACCHRVYSTRKARDDGLLLASTGLREGIRMHVESLAQ